MPILAGPDLLKLLPIPLAYYIPGVLVAGVCIRTMKEKGLHLAASLLGACFDQQAQLHELLLSRDKNLREMDRGSGTARQRGSAQFFSGAARLLLECGNPSYTPGSECP